MHSAVSDYTLGDTERIGVSVVDDGELQIRVFRRDLSQVTTQEEAGSDGQVISLAGEFGQVGGVLGGLIGLDELAFNSQLFLRPEDAVPLRGIEALVVDAAGVGHEPDPEGWGGGLGRRRRRRLGRGRGRLDHRRRLGRRGLAAGAQHQGQRQQHR